MDPEVEGTEAEGGGLEGAAEAATDEAAAETDEAATDEAATTGTLEEAADDAISAVIEDAGFADIMTPMVLLALGGIAIVCVALTTAAKHALMTLKEGGVKILDNHWFKAVLQIAQPAMGGALALAPGLLPFETPMNVILGICAGFLSPLVYSTLLRRFFPNAVVSGDSAKRTAIRQNGSGATKGNSGDVNAESGVDVDADTEPPEDEKPAEE